MNLLAKLKDATTIVIYKHQKIIKTIESIEDEIFQQCSTVVRQALSADQ